MIKEYRKILKGKEEIIRKLNLVVEGLERFSGEVNGVVKVTGVELETYIYETSTGLELEIWKEINKTEIEVVEKVRLFKNVLLVLYNKGKLEIFMSNMQKMIEEEREPF